MNALTLGGYPLESATITGSWGLSPASGSAVAVGGGPDAGTAVGITIGGATFNGEITSSIINKDDGLKCDLSLVDNRVWLMRDTVFGVFNQMEIIEDDVSTPGVDRGRRYAHILPSDWAVQKKTYTSVPLTAKQILDYLFESDDVHKTWSRVYKEPIQDKAIHEIDCNQGKKLGNVVQEIAEAQGLVFSLGGEWQIIFERKGDGSVPSIPSDADGVRDGHSMTNNDTIVRIVGDRNQYQVKVDLEPDWKTAWQEFWNECLWLKEVNTVFGPYEDSMAGHAELAAKAREVTVRQYVTAKNDSGYADFRKWGDGICRMELPAWIYIRNIVYKAYRIPPTYSIGSTPLQSMEMAGLLRQVEGTTTGTFNLSSPLELYPDGKCCILVKGVNVDLLDPRTQGLITSEQLTNMGTIWSSNNKCTLDEQNYLVVFENPVFSCSDLMLFPNQGISGINNTNPLYNIAIPNAEATTEPAQVRGVFCFSANRYLSPEVGSGNRHGVQYVSGLARHVDYSISEEGTEVPFLDGKIADEKAQEYLDAYSGQQSLYAHGGFRRHGATGTTLTGCIDRITIAVSFSEGITETVEFTKERNPPSFQGERELERRSRSNELFPGQRETRAEVKQLRAISVLSRGQKQAHPYGSADDVLTTVVGSTRSNTQTFKSDETWEAGTPVFFNDAGAVANDGNAFRGVTIANNQTGLAIPMAVDGIVPVRVKGQCIVGDTIGIDNGVGQVAYVGGVKAIGVATASCSPTSGDSVVLVPVRIGNGANASALKDFALYTFTSAGGALMVGVRFGMVSCYRRASGVLPWPSNFDAVHNYKYEFEVTGAGAAWIKVRNDITGDTNQVDLLELGHDATVPAQTATTDYLALGAWQVIDGSVVLLGTAAVGIGSQYYNYCGGSHAWGPY